MPGAGQIVSEIPINILFPVQFLSLRFRPFPYEETEI
jgi:hypothetical protein